MAKKLTPAKAKEILKDGTSWKHPLTPKQKRYMGYIAYGQKQEGGVAQTPEEQYNGLNNSPYNSMSFPVSGTNTFRGLNDNTPVLVMDSKGKKQLLFGPQDKSQFIGPVKEKKINKSVYLPHPLPPRMQMGGMDYGYTPSGKKSKIKVGYDMGSGNYPGIPQDTIPQLPMYGNSQYPQSMNTIPIPPIAGPGKSISYDKVHTAWGRENYEPNFQGPWDKAEIQNYWNNIPQAFGNTQVQRGQPIEEEMTFKYGGTWINENAVGYQMGGQVDQGKVAGQNFIEYLKSTRQVNKKSIPDRSTPNPFSNTTETLRGPYPKGYEPQGEECLECGGKMQMGGTIFKDIDEYKKGGWLKNAVNPAHKGWCSPITKPTCTGHRKAFALMMKKKHGFHEGGGEVNPYQFGGDVHMDDETFVNQFQQGGQNQQSPDFGQLLNVAGMYGSYFNSQNQFNDLQNQTRQRGMTDSLYAGSMNPAGIKGDYSNTGSNYGQFRSQQQVINQPGAFYPSFQIGGQIQMPVVPVSNVAQYAPQSSQGFQNSPMSDAPVKLPRKGDISTTTNNPGNMKYHPWMASLGAQPSGIPGQDGGVFAAFPNVQTGLKAYEMQLFGDTDGVFKSNYYKSNTPVDKALKTWSNNGYGAEIYPQIQGKTLAELTPQERDELMKRQIKKESPKMYSQLKAQNYFQEGGIVDMTPSQLKKFMAEGGMVDFV